MGRISGHPSVCVTELGKNRPQVTHEPVEAQDLGEELLIGLEEFREYSSTYQRKPGRNLENIPQHDFAAQLDGAP